MMCVNVFCLKYLVYDETNTLTCIYIIKYIDILSLVICLISTRCDEKLNYLSVIYSYRFYIKLKHLTLKSNDHVSLLISQD